MNLAEPEFKHYVLDSHALITYLEGETGDEQVMELLEQAAGGKCELLMSVVNLGEVLYIVERERGLHQVHKTLARIDELAIGVIHADRHLTFAAAHLKAQHPVAYADCFAAAMAKLYEAELVTGDKEFKILEHEVKIAWIG